MCGIAGIIGAGPDVDTLIRSLAHRGPDGIRVQHLPGASLGHARLSIIDLEGGWQPLSAAGATVIGNGEIYNYVELTKAHGLSDTLATGSDFEPLVHLYAREGPAAFDRLRGMYALCLIGADGDAWLVRDPFGIKPLYYMELDGGVAFASEPRAFAAAGLVETTLGAEAAEELLGFNYTLGETPLTGGVRRARPGERILIRNGRILSQTHTPPLEAPPATRAQRRKPSDDASMVRDLDAVLEDSVRIHQRSDAPFGLFLSGGVDSTAIGVLMARLNERPVTAFTCGFTAPGAADERGQAERVARALGMEWREVSFGEEDFWNLLPQVAWAMDDPMADYAALPTYRLAQAARGELTVVLTGEGGDELFGGYGRYRRALRPRWLGGRPAEPRPDKIETLDRWRRVVRPPAGLTRLQEAQWADIVTWLPNDLLLKLDRCLMANGLEGRTPFLDREVAAFAFNLPDKAKVRGRHGKWILRRWLEEVCPAAQPWARKQGFTVPVDAWIDARAGVLGETLSQSPALRRRRSAEEIQATFRAPNPGRRWPLLFLAAWSLIHEEGVAPSEVRGALLGEA